MKEEYLQAIKDIGIDITKLKYRYFENGKYGEPEMWLYKQFLTGQHGYLITKETIEDLKYLKEYLYDFL
jgi:hypothetical protein